MPYHFLLLPKIEAMEHAGQPRDITTMRTRFWAKFEKVRDKISPFESLFVIFPCQSGAADHSKVHEPFEIQTPGPVLQSMAPVLKALSTLLKITATVGAVAGYPLPPGLPFLENLQNQDQISFLGSIYDDALRVDEDGALNPTDESQWTQDTTAVVEGAATAADRDAPPESGMTETRAAYDQMVQIMQDEHGNWRAKCGLRRMCVADPSEIGGGPMYRWVCAKCAGNAEQLNPRLETCQGIHRE